MRHSGGRVGQDEMSTDALGNRPHFVYSASRTAGPLDDPFLPVLPRGARVAGHQVHMEVSSGEAITEDEAVDMLGAFSGA